MPHRAAARRRQRRGGRAQRRRRRVLGRGGRRAAAARRVGQRLVGLRGGGAGAPRAEGCGGGGGGASSAGAAHDNIYRPVHGRLHDLAQLKGATQSAHDKRTIAQSLLAVEFDLRPAPPHAPPSLRAPAARLRAHLNCVELLVHLPFAKRLAEFWLQPLVEPPFADLATARDQPGAEPSLDLDLDVRLQQTDVVLINHKLGPSMPLLLLHVQAALLHLALRRDGSRLRLNIHLPLELKAYNVATQGYDVCVEPAIVGVHVAIATPWRFAESELRMRHQHTSVGVCCSPLFVTVTQSLVKSYAAAALGAERTTPS